MKIIYTEEVLNRMAQRDGVEAVNKLVASGETKATEDKVPYVVVIVEDQIMSEDFMCEECCSPKGNPCTCELQKAANKVLRTKYPFHPPQDAGYWLDMFKEGAKYQLEVYKDYIKLLKEELAYEKRNKIVKEL